MSNRDTKNKEIRKRRKSFHKVWEAICANLYSVLYDSARYKMHKHTYRGFTITPDDLVQATVSRVLWYCPEPSRIKNKRAYLLQILKTIWCDILRIEMEVNMTSVDDDSNEGSPAFEVADPSIDIHQMLEQKELIDVIRTDPGPLTDREAKLFKLFLKGMECDDIANLMGEDVRIIRYDLNAVRTKVIKRFQKRFGAKS